MAEYSKLVLTRKGLGLINKILAGQAKDVEFTKIAASAAKFTVEELEDLTELPEIMQEAEISRKTQTNAVSLKVETAFSNTELTVGYPMNVLGLYAVDPDDGEILYAAATEISGHDCYMPPYNGITVSGAYIQLVTTVGNVDNVSLEVNPSVYATIGDIQELRKLIKDIQTFIGMDGSEGGWGKDIREHIEDQDNPHNVTAAQIQYEGKPLTAFLKSLEESASTDRAIQNIPTQYGALTYNGEEQTLVLNGYDPATILLTGVTKATEAGEYKALATPKSPHYWGADGSNNTKEITWTIGRKPVEKPTQTNSLTYTGEEQAPTFEGIQADIMTLGGKLSGTAAGTYAATVTLNNNYQWPDGTSTPKEVLWTIAKAPGSVSLNMNTIELRASAMSALIAVTRAGDGAITASSSNPAVATVSVSGNMVTVTAKNKGSATITINVAEGTNHTAPDSITASVTVTLPTATLKDNSWATVQDVITGGQEANFWSVGDVKPVTLNGKVGNFTFSNVAVDAFILGFNHNASREGNKRTHFLLGKISGKDVALCDSRYGNEQTSAGYFHMNTSRTNSGGWSSSAMRNTLLNGASNSLFTALPADLRAVISATTKYTDNTGGGSNTASYVTATSDKLWLPSEFEVFGTRNYANSAEQNYQQQYDYFKAGNSRISYNHSAVTTAVWWWLRSPYYNGSNRFCYVYTGGGNSYDNASWSAGVRAGFTSL